MRQILPSPKYRKRQQRVQREKPLSNCFLTDQHNLEIVRKKDKDFRENPVRISRNERAKQRLLEKEKREGRWKKNDPKWRVELFGKDFL